VRCALCGGSLAGDVVRPGPEFGDCHRACFDRYDREDERAMFQAMKLEPFGPEELVALAEIRTSERKPPKRAGAEPSVQRSAA
jgi:hypothetical protein